MSSSDCLRLAKKALRTEMIAVLKNLTVENLEQQCIRVSDKLFASAEFENSRRISVYLSMERGELQTIPIVEKILDTGRLCFIPRYSKAGMEMVCLQSMDDYYSLPETRWKIKQPRLEEKRENASENGGLDLVICPGVAFTRDGVRLGHGAGYYDKYLSCLSEEMSEFGKQPVVVGLALREQILESVPSGTLDFKMDKVFFDE